MIIKNISLEEIQSRVSRLIKDATKSELQFKEILISNKIDFEFQWVIDAGTSYYIADFYLPKYNTIIEIDGYYHFTEEGKAKDKRRDSFLKFKKYKVIHIPNSKIYEFDFISVTNTKSFKSNKPKQKSESKRVKTKIEKEWKHLEKIKTKTRKQEKLFNLYKLQYPYLFK